MEKRGRIERRVELQRFIDNKNYKFISLRVKLGIKEHERVSIETDSKNSNNFKYCGERYMSRLVRWDKWSRTHKSVNNFIHAKVKEGFKVTENSFAYRGY